jgi:uncharacterized protein
MKPPPWRQVARPALLLASLLFMAMPLPSIAAPTDKAIQAMRADDFNAALDELRPLAAKNDRDAQFLLGMLYDAGKGVAQDPAAAASWYRKAAKQNHLLAQAYLGAMLYSGQGVQQDYAEAARWFRAPADSGNDQAQFYLGSMYASGAGVKKDDSEAIRWLGKAAAQRNTRAMGMLATTLFSRHRDGQDLVDAYAWSHLAAEMDPIQATTSARAVIEQYCNDDQKKRGKATMADWKRTWAKEAKARPSAH